MKFLKLLAISLCLIVLAASAACSIGQSTNTQPQAAASRGDLTVIVSGSGKTSYANDAKLAFGSAGKIEKLNIKKGDSVAKNTVLAQLETDNLKLALSEARVNEAAAKAAVTQARMTVTQAEIAVTLAQLDVTQAESMKTQAEASVTTAQFNLDRTQAVSDVKDDITNAEIQMKLAQMQIKDAARFSDSNEMDFWKEQMEHYSADITKYQKKLAELLAKEEYTGIATYEIGGQKYDRLIVEDVRIKQQQLKIAQQAVEQASQTIVKAQQNVEQAKLNTEKYLQSVEQARLTAEQAAKVVEVAQKQLDSAVILSPFDGVIAGLDVKQNDFVISAGLSAGTPIYMIEPGSLEINTEVDEIDIANVQPGQKAVITLDAVPGLQIEGKVTAISLLPVIKTQNTGVVVYEVKVGFTGDPPAWAKSGMSAGVAIVTAEKKGVVLVPSQAIKQNSQGQKTIAVLVNQKTQEKPVTPGLSGGSQTEIVSGINEGEIVLLGP
jgi:HlyD family secretion protein